jgi:hypothetical protein
MHTFLKIMYVVFRLESHLKTENKDSAWLLLALISGHVQLRDPAFAMEYFIESIHSREGVRGSTPVLQSRVARFFLLKHTKRGKMYQMTIKYTK